MRSFLYWTLLLAAAAPASALPKLGAPEGNEALEIQRRQDFFYRRRALPDGTFAPQARVRALSAVSGMRVRALSYRPLGASVAISSPWEEIGPKPAGVSGYGFAIASGRVNSIAVHPTDPNTVYIGASFGGVAKSTDGGTNWTYLTGAMPSQAVSSVALDTTSPSIVYAGTGDPYYSGNGVSLLGVGVYRSTDSGATWGLISGSDNLGGGVVRKLAIDPATSGSQTATRLYAAVSGGTAPGLYVSADSGATWTHDAGVGLVNCFDVVADPTNAAKVYSLCSDYVRYSSNSGASWPTAFFPNPSGSKGHLAMAGSTVYMAFSSPGPYTNPAFGTDPDLGGQLYVTPNASTTPTEIAAARGFCNAQCTYDIYVEVDPSNANRLFLGGVDASVSIDGGSTFTDYAPFNPPNMIIHSDHHALAFAPSNPSVIYEGNDGGMYKSANGGSTWTNLNQNLSGDQVIGIGVSHDGKVIAGLQDNGNEVFANNGGTAWTMIDGGDGGFAKIDPANSAKMYYTYVNVGAVSPGLVTRTVDGGGTVADITPAPAMSAADGSEFYPTLSMVPSDAARLLFGGTAVYRSPNSGANWYSVGGALDGNYISAAAEAPSNANVVYAGTDGNYFGNGTSRVYATANATLGLSATWALGTGLPTAQTPTSIAVDPTNPSVAYVTFSQYGTTLSPKSHVFKTVNRGSSWTDVSASLPDVPFNDIVIDSAAPTHLYAASDVGVFASQDGGATWAVSNAGLPDGIIANALSLHAGTRELVVGTYGMGAYRVTLLPAPPKTAPAGLAAKGLGVSSASWSWSALNGATGYNFYPSTGGAAIAVAGTAVVLEGLSPNAAYSGQVSALNAGGEGPLSAAVTTYALAAAPAGFALTGVGVTSATVQWGDGGNPAGTSYEVGWWKPGVSTAVKTVSVTSAVVTGLTGATTYYLRVRAKNAKGFFSPPDVFLATRTLHAAPGAAPSGLLAFGRDASTVTWTWKPVAGATGYEFYPATGGAVIALTTTTVSFTGLSTNTACGGKVAATTEGGHGPLTATATGYTLAATPTGTVAYSTGVFISSAVVQWADAAVPAATKYKVEYWKWATPATVLVKYSTTTYAALTSLASNTSYYARVRAVNAKSQLSAPDAQVSIWTAPPKPTAAPSVTAAPVPATPIASLAVGSVTWSWKPVAGAEAYGVQPSTGGPEIVTLSTSVALEGLAPNTPHGVKVRVINVNGAGPLSATVTGYTLAATPTNAAVVFLSSASLTLSWDNVGAPSYKIDVTSWTRGSMPAAAVVTGTTKVYTGLQPSTTYYLRIRSLNSKLVPGLPATAKAITHTSSGGVLALSAAPRWSWEIPSAAPQAPAPVPVSAALAAVVAFPNPVLAGQPGVNFVHLPPGAAIRISSPAGTLVRALAAGKLGAAFWNGKDSAGKAAPNGSYPALIESGGASRTIVVELRR